MLIASHIFRDLFTVDDAGLAPLPYIITALLLGLILAQVYLTYCRTFEGKLLVALHAAGAIGKAQAIPLSQLLPEGASKWTSLLLSSPSASIYRWVSNGILDERAEKGFSLKEKKAKIQLELTPDTPFYIKEEFLPYVEERGIKATGELWMGVVYTALSTGVVWFILLYLLDDILALFV